MGGDRLGMRWGLAGGTTIATVEQARRVARYADAAGFDGLWISHATGVDPVVALACVADDIPNLGEVGTSVTPLYGRHPIALAQLARTAQSALGGRFTLGIGAASRGAVATTMGLAWEHPLEFTREFIDGLQPLLAGRPVDLDGTQLSAHVELGIEAPDTPILLAALGPRMLELAGRRVAGTSVGQCGPRTIGSYIAPTIRAAAEAAGRPAPRIMALVRICVTDEPSAAFALAQATATRYRQVPSYRAVQDREGLADPAELHLIGSWERVLDGLAAYGGAGATDLRLEVAAPDEASREATREALAAHLG
ncbi:TIGR03564 family F420-dependent LLM class oxidoreductase [Pseudonocardia lacus]|uniref:TIGR03564 family F420-dependent LLM class oxidoreductase n=1 Tax=Pseudonocardia lacus TaxID=2835865 RepID=UPI001BDCD078|nr:TIGR03564 family F420-dependent LLM class oxidoreductase [Pseudonocardia lacus]